MIKQRLLAGAIFLMTTMMPTSGAAQSSETSGSVPVDHAVRFLVTLPVKPDHLDGFLTTMRKEVAGARSEGGNIAFDVFQRSDDPGTLYLFEHWTSEAALDSHTEQPYYKTIRAQEADDLAGAVDERDLSEVSPTQEGKRPEGIAGYPVLSIIRAKPGAEAGIRSIFARIAEEIRAMGGNRAFALFQDRDRPTTFLLIEQWDDSAAREIGMATTLGKEFISFMSDVADLPVQPIKLIDRSRS